MNLLKKDHCWLTKKTWYVTDDAEGGTRVYGGSYLLCDGGYHRWPCLVFPQKTGEDGSPVRMHKWSKLVESVRKDIECTFGILKIRFKYLKHFNRSHNVSDVDNAFTTCCTLHNMLLEEDGYLRPDRTPKVGGRNSTIRKNFKKGPALDGIWLRGEDNTPDPLMDLEEARHCPFEKIRLESKWLHVSEVLANHYHTGQRLSLKKH